MHSISKLLVYILFLFVDLHRLQANEQDNFSEIWNEIKPGGNSICARGGEFSFFMSEGSSDNVIIDFIGGGACWDSFTCAKETATFSDNVEYLKEMHKKGELRGIYERNRIDNPFKDWSHIVIPYCTGDIHWGDSVVDYTTQNGDNFTINHKGAINVQTTLKWIKENISLPKKILVTGCSAGSYGSIYWTPKIREMFVQSKLHQLGDSGTGVITDDFFRKSFPKWNATAKAPTWIPDINPEVVDWHTLKIEDLYSVFGNYYLNAKYSQVTSAFDDNQVFYYEMMGGNPIQWSSIMYGKMEHIENNVDSFRTYVFPGDDHCILPYERFYTVQSSGVYFKNWIEDFVSEELPPSVYCQDCNPNDLG